MCLHTELDEKLSWKLRIQCLLIKLFQGVGIIAKVNKHLNDADSKMLYVTFIFFSYLVWNS